MSSGMKTPQENEQVGIGSYPCQYCDKTYSYEWPLKNHIKVVHGPDKVKCPNCKQCFARPYNLREHLKSGVCNPTVAAYNLERYKCLHCETCYTQRKSLNRHMSNMHPIKENNDKQCHAQCHVQCLVENVSNDRDWEESVLTNLLTNVAAYNREWYKCPHCGKCFSQKKSLKIHNCKFVCKHVLEIGVNKFNKETLTICGFKYKDQEDKNVHMSKVHPKEKKSGTYVYAENVEEDKNWKENVFTSFSPIKETPVPEKKHNMSKKGKNVKIKKCLDNIEDVDNIDEIEENTFDIEMGKKKIFNIDSMIEEVAIDTMEEGEIIDEACISSYITEQGEIQIR